MSNLMLHRMASCACLNTISPEIKRVIGMRMYMTFKTFSVFHRNTFYGLQRLFHNLRLPLGDFMTLKAQARFPHCQVLLFRGVETMTHTAAAFRIASMNIILLEFCRNL